MYYYYTCPLVWFFSPKNSRQNPPIKILYYIVKINKIHKTKYKTFFSIILNKTIREWQLNFSFTNLRYGISYSTIIRSSNIFFHCYCILHKSVQVFTFGLLLSSLIMLSAIPMLNNNNSFTKTAMAQGYYGDSSSNYYSQYPTDDKKYECRTGPFEGFL